MKSQLELDASKAELFKAKAGVMLAEAKSATTLDDVVKVRELHISLQAEGGLLMAQAQTEIEKIGTRLAILIKQL